MSWTLESQMQCCFLFLFLFYFIFNIITLRACGRWAFGWAQLPKQGNGGMVRESTVICTISCAYAHVCIYIYLFIYLFTLYECACVSLTTWCFGPLKQLRCPYFLPLFFDVFKCVCLVVCFVLFSI
ncbi:hypothetical protein, unlikely [Trypanosoma brucei gambiense DAL972]|uniref:Uncharacterized protein n=1 Tax=Trypanosoma brucei gambiense (strain MHOM/CI/86/DAL972) TaxID=679716 RepID=C9ZN27_TRYB9|nr:hypothetical protein, unlikely [Trypanosoma brucei gambiense DAL972]CBH10681.1 hypothetical protein, unlikely [Trypanosoma brucei gambiense DAL972]|eukprot:XP_011772969.1 hypothetical protein, unlikely [Trypanosoma brucei gambiense DAL972]